MSAAMIALQGKSFNPIEVDQEVARTKLLENQNKLSDIAFQDRDAALQSAKSLRDITRASVDPETGEIIPTMMRKGLAASGDFNGLQAFEKSQTEKTKSGYEVEAAKYTNALKKIEIAERIASGVSDQATLDAARQQIAQQFGPEAAASLPQVYDPKVMEANKLRAMPIKDRLSAELARLEADRKEREFQYRQKNDKENRETTDQRARDFNETKVEENRLKREAKQEAANLTKASQIASFDTMLGTLDRLSTHKGLARSVGITGAMPTIPGSDSANFQAELNTFKSQAFIPMVSQLKGMGALSDAEGAKITAAVGALDPKMGEQAFRDSIALIMKDMKAARDRMVNGSAKPNEQKPPSKAVNVGGSQMEAKLAADGHYYVKQANGKYARVE